MAVPARKMDRRVVRTRQALRDALMALVTEKGYEAITIQEIADRADVNRATFYLHFRDKEELLLSSLRELYDALGATVPSAASAEQMGKAIAGVLCDPIDFRHIAAHADFYRAIIGKHGSTAFRAMIQAYLEQIFKDTVVQPLMSLGQERSIPLDLIASYLAGAEIGVIVWWLRNNLASAPEDMAQQVYRLTVFGVPRALGVDPALLSDMGSRKNSPD